MSFYDEMKKMIEEFIPEESEYESSYGSIEEDFFNSEFDHDNNPFGSVTIEHVDNYGGEDCGREYYSIYKFTRGDEVCYIKFDGWYASHYGSEYENMFEVKPKEVMVTQFFNV